jgi:D-lactate dehydrogenase
MATNPTSPETTLTPSEIKSLLSAAIDQQRILTRPIQRVAYAADASFYRLVPRAVVRTKDVAEIQALFRFSHEHRIPMTFRAAGTSLSGQAISDGMLVDVARHWRAISVEENGQRVRVQPGVIGAHANRILAAYGAKIGPDPASIATCTLGGILANNSSGMCCGVAQNAYHTLASMRFILPSGTLIDTSAKDADELFHAREPELARGLLQLKERIESDSSLRERIRSKYRMKNTTGYSLNAFLDFDRAVDIFAHLLIGSEGTLAFIAEAVLNTVPDLPIKYTGLLLFPDLYAASASIVPFREAGAKALEIMDRASLRSVETQPGIPPSIRTLPQDAAGLLIEFQAAEAGARRELEDRAREAANGLVLLESPQFTHHAAEQAALWKIRAGMFPSVGSVRESGTAVIIEDVAFPIDQLAPAAQELTVLFRKHRYDNAIIFGHAKDGNLHFVIAQSFNEQSAVDQYARFIDDVVTLVVDRYDGALKAEHGTGRNMAPFVEHEWGREGYEIMRRVKQLSDPHGLLNPDVIISGDRRAHLANLKQMPSVEPEIDKCIECGYCEPKCPSRELTLTPRQRIVVRREMARIRQGGADEGLYNALDADFPYEVLDTCAVDGLCSTACPVGIDTGQLVKRFRSIRYSPWAHRVSLLVAQNFRAVEKVVRRLLHLAHAAQKVIGTGGMQAITGPLRFVTGNALPSWVADTPLAAKASLPATSSDSAQAIYFPSCISRVMGRLPGEERDRPLAEVTVEVAQRAGVRLHIPADVSGTCCGVPFSSKGFDRAHAVMVNATIEKLWRWSEMGRLPIIVDTSPCTYGLRTSRQYLTSENQQRFDQLKIVDAIEFVHDELLSKLTVHKRASSVALHPVCSVVKMGITAKLENIARACSVYVTVPDNAGCCAFAGDRGFLVPELTASATKAEADEVKSGNHDGYYSSSRTCEIGMTRATGKIYRSYMYLLEHATRPNAK